MIVIKAGNSLILVKYLLMAFMNFKFMFYELLKNIWEGFYRSRLVNVL